jgi:hypothetical protein
MGNDGYRSRGAMPGLEDISGPIRASAQVYNHAVEFLNRNRGRKLGEVMDAEIDISDVVQ